METKEKINITVQTIVYAPVEKTWKLWTSPEHITQWNNASPDWHTPRAENDLRAGGKFLSRMEAKDGSFGFDFWSVYKDIQPNKSLSLEMGDGRSWDIQFESNGNETKVTEVFEAEQTNPIEMQRGGWQMILNNFKPWERLSRHSQKLIIFEIRQFASKYLISKRLLVLLSCCGEQDIITY